MRSFVYKIMIVGVVVLGVGGCTDNERVRVPVTTTSRPLPGDVRMHDSNSNLTCEDVRVESGHLMRCE